MRYLFYFLLLPYLHYAQQNRNPIKERINIDYTGCWSCNDDIEYLSHNGGYAIFKSPLDQDGNVGNKNNEITCDGIDNLTGYVNSDSLIKLIPKQRQKSIIKLAKNIRKADSPKKLTSSINQINTFFSYYLNSPTNFKHSIVFVREIQYFLNLTKNIVNIKIDYTSEIRDFVTKANVALNAGIINGFKFSSPTFENYSELWLDLVKIESYPWVNILRYEDDFKSDVYQPILKYYFKRFQSIDNYNEQNELINHFTKHFPEMDSNNKVIAFVFGEIEDDICSGDFKLFNHNFFEHWVVGEGEQLRDLPWWLAKNEKNNTEISDIYKVLLDSISLCKFSLCKKKLCGITEMHKNNQLYFRIYYDNYEDGYSSSVNSVVIYENGEKTKEVHFDGWKRFSFYFEKGINITERGIYDTLQLAYTLVKLDKPEFERALQIISTLDWHKFPDTLSLKKQIDLTKNEILNFSKEWKKERINTLIKEAQIYVNSNNFEQGRKSLKLALDICYEESSNAQTIKNLLTDLDKKEDDYKENLDRKNINNSYDKIKKLKFNNSFDDAITLLEDVLRKYPEKKYPELEMLRKEITEIKKLKLASENQKKEALAKEKFNNAIRELDFTKIGKVEISKDYLRVTQFTNGDKLDFASTAEEFAKKTLKQIPTYCFYNFDRKFESKGYYYNVFALNDINGRQLFTDDYRLPFASEIEYMIKFVIKLESSKNYDKRLELKNYLFKSNAELAYNGMNIVNYERNTFNATILDEKIKNNNDAFGKHGYIDDVDDLAHMFWILSDYKFDEDGEIEDYSKFLDINYKRKNYTDYDKKIIENPIIFTIAKFNYKNKYYNDEQWSTLSEMDIESVIPSWRHGKDYDLWGAQIKLVRQRQEIMKSDWSPLCTSTSLKFNYETGYGKEKFETKTIVIAKNQEEWLHNCNNKIPSCASYNFDASNDSKFGILYNQFVFEYISPDDGNNYPLQLNTKLMDIIDLSNLRYSFDGSNQEFYQLLYESHGLKFGGKCEFDEKKKKLLWMDNLNDDFGFIPVAIYDRHGSKDCRYLILGYGTDKDNKFYLSHWFSKLSGSAYNPFRGYSIRFLKN